MKSERFFELLIKFYKGNISKMKLAEILKISNSQLKIYLDRIEKIIIEDFKIAFGIKD